MKSNLKQLNTCYQSDPNTANPIIELYKNQLTLKFQLNTEIHGFMQTDIGKITFANCLMFRVGSPNDEGYTSVQEEGIRYSPWNKIDFPQIKWDSFYEVESSDWSSIIDYEGYTNNKLMETVKDKSKFKHFAFFMKEATFECVAESYIEEIPVK